MAGMIKLSKVEMALRRTVRYLDKFLKNEDSTSLQVFWFTFQNNRQILQEPEWVRVPCSVWLSKLAFSSSVDLIYLSKKYMLDISTYFVTQLYLS